MSTELVLPNPIAQVRQLRLAAARPAIFLSASVPVALEANRYMQADRVSIQEENERFTGGVRPERVRAAVSALTRVAMQHGLRLVFGAHPTISPMVLQAAMSMDALDESVLVFQSDAYRTLIPSQTLSLANWSKGRLVLTEQQPEAPRAPPHPGLKYRHPFPSSLKFMRELMMKTPGIVGGVFIGGLSGVEDEAALLGAARKRVKRYAIASTGGAAAVLAQQAGYHGTLGDPRILSNVLSYTVVASQIVQDLLLPSARGP